MDMISSRWHKDERDVLHYRVNGKYFIPRLLYIAVRSWIVVVALVTAVLAVCWVFDARMHVDLLNLAPRSLTALLDVAGAYAGIGGICLWVTMWVYWIAVERGGVLARIGWFLLLLLGLCYGALIYAITVWAKGRIVPVEVPAVSV